MPWFLAHFFAVSRSNLHLSRYPVSVSRFYSLASSSSQASLGFTSTTFPCVACLNFTVEIRSHHFYTIGNSTAPASQTLSPPQNTPNSNTNKFKTNTGSKATFRQKTQSFLSSHRFLPSQSARKLLSNQASAHALQNQEVMPSTLPSLTQIQTQTSTVLSQNQVLKTAVVQKDIETRPPKLERQLTSTFDKHVLDDSASDHSNTSQHSVHSGHSIHSLDTTNSTKPKKSIEHLFSTSNSNTNLTQAKLQAIEKVKEVEKSEADLTALKLNLLTGEATDIGGGHENQDKSMCFRCGRNNEHLVLGVFDGHGRELGEIAAIVARDFMKEQLKNPALLEAIEHDPKPTLSTLFLKAHEEIKRQFKSRLANNELWDVFEHQDGYLIKRSKLKQAGYKRMSQVMETNVHGGTTATVCVVLNSRHLIVANVGDSTALFGGVDSNGKIFVKELSAEHSPESPQEFVRVHRHHHHKSSSNNNNNNKVSLHNNNSNNLKRSSSVNGLSNNIKTENNLNGNMNNNNADNNLDVVPYVESEVKSEISELSEVSETGRDRANTAFGLKSLHPQALRFVYDVIDRLPNFTPKHSCPPIFSLSNQTQNNNNNTTGVSSATKISLSKSNNGFYYKNVRSEWATLVTTPPNARFQDALAFTRSLGDLHLHVYGVSHVPAVKVFDLNALHNLLKSSNSEGDEQVNSCLLVCTDGIWDNWKYEDCVRFVIECSKAKRKIEFKDTLGQEVCDELMAQNIRLAKQHFGSQADNMTAVLTLNQEV